MDEVEAGQEARARRREEAWIGDAVLALFVREWLLGQREIGREDRTEAYTFFTSNAFLNTFGEPTGVEAQLGRLYAREGREAAFAFIEEHWVPVFRKRWRRRR